MENTTSTIISGIKVLTVEEVYTAHLADPELPDPEGKTDLTGSTPPSNEEQAAPPQEPQADDAPLATFCAE